MWELYHQQVDCLVCLTCSQPNISYTVSLLKSFAAKPRKDAQCTLCYISGTFTDSILYHPDAQYTLTGQCTSHWVNFLALIAHLLALVAHLGPEPISWSSTCQPIVSILSLEAKHWSACYASCEAIWLCWLLNSDLTGHVQLLPVGDHPLLLREHVNNLTDYLTFTTTESSIIDHISGQIAHDCLRRGSSRAFGEITLKLWRTFGE